MSSIIDMNNKRDISIMLVRIIATAFIFIDHWAAYVDIPLKSVVIQVTNSGVLIFLFISGFLYGGKNISNIKTWLMGRIKKLLIPYWIFLFCFYVLSVLFRTFSLKSFVIYFFVLQAWLGTDGGPITLWFMSLLFICYLLVPVLQYLKKRRFNKWIKSVILISIFCIQFFLSYYSNVTFDFGHPLDWYLVAIFMFVVGYYTNSYFTKVNITLRLLVIVTIFAIFGCAVRIIGQNLFDGTVLYDHIISVWSNAILDIWIFVFIRFVIFRYEMNIIKKKFLCVINFLDSLSYSFYLVHATVLYYLSILIVDNCILFLVITFITSLISALLLNKLSAFIMNPLQKNK